MTYAFDEETRLEAVGEGRYTTTLSDAWNIGENPNGGYLLAPLQRAMGLVSGHPDPLTVTTHYLRPGQAGPAEIEVELVRTGRTIGTVRGRLVQDGKTRLESMAAFTDLSTGDEVAEVSVAPPPMPPPDECPSRAHIAQGVDLPIMERIDVRIHPDHVIDAQGRDPVINGWIRFCDERPIEAAVLTLFSDAFPPPLFALVGRIGWVPTIELTVQIRRRPADGWLLGSFRTSDLAGARVIEDGQLWDSNGDLVALSRQVGLVLRSTEP